MPKPSLSIYRGYCAKGGIGELPEDPAGAMRGEQYIAADPRLWNNTVFPDLANEIRRWMTLYDDQRINEVSHKLGENVEGWSYFGYGAELRFVARLGSGGEFGPRLAYFTHARAWDFRDFQNGDDPGAFLGCSTAFVQSWKEGQEIPRVEEALPVSPWKEVVEAKPWAAIRLVAQLYRACVGGPPVVMGVPYREFVREGKLHQLVSFARAALPLAMKRDCRIRVFTGRPEIYLREMSAHLIVVPEELAADALTARPDAALLDMDCETRAGSAADTAYAAYAHSVVDRFLQLPQFLLAFTGRAKFSPGKIPDAAQAAGVAVSYNLLTALGDTARMDTVLSYFCQEAERRQVPLDWNELIQPGEWAQFSDARLTEVALSSVTSADLGALRQRARRELVHRGAMLDEATQKWIARLPVDIRAREILELVDVKLVSHPAASVLMQLVTGGEISRLLEDPATAGLVAKLIASGDVPQEWLGELTRGPKHLRMMMGFAKENDGWRQVVDKIIENLISAPEMLASVTADLPDLPPPDPNASLENYLNWAEFLLRVGAPRAASRIENLTQALTGREGRRRFFRLLDSPKWRSTLENFVAPGAWDKDIGDLLLESERQLACIGTDRILRFPQLKADLTERVRLLLDQRMQASAKSTTQSLIETDLWLTWRLATTLNVSELRECAVNWLLTAPSDAKLEEWKLVVSDLSDPARPGITLDDLGILRSRFQGRQRPWPQIRPFEDEQLRDLAQLCGSLGILAELAEAADSENPDYALALRNSRFSGFIPPQALQCLGKNDVGVPALSLDAAEYLVRNAGHRVERARAALGRAVLFHLIGHTEQAEAAANAANVWTDPAFHQLLVQWLVQNSLNPAYDSQRQLLALLEARLSETRRFNVRKPFGAAELARSYSELGFKQLAELLSPARTQDSLYRNLVEALVRNDVKSNSWKQMIDHLDLKSANAEEHPLMILANMILELPWEEQRKIDRYGWETFKAVCESDSQSLRILGSQQGVLPVLHLAAILRDRDSVGAVASGILTLKGVAGYGQYKEWWAALFESIRVCQRRSGVHGVRDRLEAAGAVIFSAMGDLNVAYPAGFDELDKYMMAVLSERDSGAGADQMAKPGRVS